MKPSDYRAPFIIYQDTDYQVNDQSSKETHASTGTLHVGRVVWSQGHLEEKVQGQLVSCYAEGVGIVSVDAGNLRSVR